MVAQGTGSDLHSESLSITLFNMYLERIMCDALDEDEGSVSIGGRLINNFHFADDIVVNAEEETEVDVLVHLSIQPH